MPLALSIGIALGIAAALAFNLGLALQKRASGRLPRVAENPGGDVATVKAFFSDPIWLAGSTCLLLGWGLEWLALLYAPIGLVLPAMPAGGALLAILAVRWFGEHLRKSEWAGVVACCGGAVLLGLSLDPDREVAGTHIVVAPLVVVVVVAFGLAALASLAIRSKRARAEIVLPLAAGIAYGATGLLTKALGVALTSTHPAVDTSLVVIALVVLSAAGLVLLQAAWQRGRAIVVATLTTTLSTGLPVLVGPIAFDEPWPNGMKLAVRIGAFLLILLGAIALATRTNPPSAPSP